MKKTNLPESIDPHISQMFNRLRPTPERDPAVVDQNRQRFLKQLDTISLPISSETAGRRRIFGSLLFLPDVSEVKNMFTRTLSLNNRSFVTTLVVLAIALTFLFGGSTATVMAAESAIPGDALYGFKTQVEKTRISMTSSALTRAELQLQFAERRLEETKLLVAEGRFQNIAETTAQFENNINNALAELDQVTSSDPALAASLLSQITATLSRYTDLLDQMAAEIPETVEAELQQNIKALRSMRDDEVNSVSGDHSDDEDNSNDASYSDVNENDHNSNDASYTDDNSNDENNNDASYSEDNGNDDNSNDVSSSEDNENDDNSNDASYTDDNSNDENNNDDNSNDSDHGGDNSNDDNENDHGNENGED